ncbi:MAG: hypothetical protein FDX18_01700 [Chlorobium sp.]|nr:MAG: hypothetical protein FDX18_01700 [Chlorobium sp.]
MKILAKCQQENPAGFPATGLPPICRSCAVSRSCRCRGMARRAPTTAELISVPVWGSIPTVIRSFKSAVTKGINDTSQSSARCVVWQRNYWEHLIRDEGELQRIQEYIRNNPFHWSTDQLYSSGCVA